MTGRRAAARRHPGLTFVALPCTVLALAVLALWPAPHRRGAPAPAGTVGVAPIAQNRPAPNFSRPLVQGAGQLALGDLRGNLVVINFWASWCAQCREEVPQLRRLARRQKGVMFLGVDEQDTRAGGEGFLRRYRPGYRNVADPGGTLLRAFGSAGVPSTYILDRRGRIRYEIFGALDASALSDAVGRVARDA